MASNVTVQSVLGKISQDHLECSICSYRYKQPKLLDCLHSFCLICLQELRLRQEPESTKLPCPLCRQDTLLKGDVAALPDNFTLGALVEEFRMQEQLLEGQGSAIKCQNCDEGNKAVSRCMNCNSFLCRECNKAHRRMSAMQTHEVTTMAQLRSGKISYKSKLREKVLKCGNHPDQNLSIYCDTCQQLACTTCSVQDHAKHSLIGQTEALGKCRREIAEATAKAEQKRAELSTAKQEVDNIRKALDGRFAETYKKIEQKVEEGAAWMTEAGQILKQQAEKIYQDRVKILDTALATNSKEVSDTEQKLEEMKQLIDQASCHETLKLKQKLLHNLRQLTMKQPKRVRWDMHGWELSSMDFQGGEIRQEIGKILIVEKPSPRKETPSLARYWEVSKVHNQIQSATHVAAFSDNEVIIVDAECKHLISTSLKTPASSAVTKQLKIYDLHNPTCVAVNKHDELIILAGPVVTTYNRMYRSLRQFRPGRKPNSKPTCLAVDDNNQIAVGYQNTEEISLHYSRGKLVRRLSAPGIGHYLTMSKDRLIYTNCKKLQSVDYEGAMVFSKEIQANDDVPSDAQGLCCDREGNIYVAFSQSHSPFSDEIHRFSPDGEHVGCVIKIGTRNCANGIAFTPSGNLVVAAGSSVRFYAFEWHKCPVTPSLLKLKF